MCPQPRILLDDLVFPEGPRWWTDRLLFSDMHAGRVRSVDLDGKMADVSDEISGHPSGLGFLPDGTLVIVSMQDRQLVTPAGTTLADLSEVCPAAANDMVIDRHGRMYVGNFGFDPFSGEPWCTTRLVCVEPDGRARRVGTELMFPNGMVITPDERTLLVAETPACKITAFDIHDDGDLGSPRTWADVPGLPDGICLDADGMLWVSCPMTGTFESPGPGAHFRIEQGGTVTARIDAEGFGATAVMLGGPDGDHLFLLEAKEADPSKIAGPGNGRIRVSKAPAAHAGWP